MDVRLVNPRGPAGVMVSFPQGLMQIAAELRAHGHQVRIVDYSLHDAAPDFPELNGADVVGISIMSPQLPQALAVAEHLAKQGTTRVVWGGVHVTLDPVSILSRYPDHYVIRGEGEKALLELLEFFVGRRDRDFLRHRPGICFTDDGAAVLNPPAYIPDLNELADIDFLSLGSDLEAYITSSDYFFGHDVRRLQVLVARGCHWNCTFCINPIYKKSGGKYRAKSIEKIRRESESIIDSLDIQFVEPRDEDFFIKKDLLKDWVAYAKEKKFLWSANGRFNYFMESLLSPDRLRELHESGLYSIGMSIETGDEHIRNKIIKKQVKDSDIERCMEFLNASVGRQISIATSFISYFPGDTPLSRMKIIPLMFKLIKGANVAFSGPQIYRSYPGSPLYDQEELKYEGDLDFYLNMLFKEGTSAGASSPICEQRDAIFYSTLLPEYFNGYFHRYENQEGGGYVLAKDNIGFRRELYWAMVSLRLRDRLNYWGCFIDPWVIPSVHNGLKWALPHYERMAGTIRTVWSLFKRLTPARVVRRVQRQFIAGK